MSSTDNGQSWSEPRVLWDGPIDDRDAGVLETRRGTLLVTTFTSLAYEPILAGAAKEGNWPAERLAAWRQAHERLSAPERQAALGQWMIRSEDGGRIWSAPYSVELRDGSLLTVWYELPAGKARAVLRQARWSLR